MSEFTCEVGAAGVVEDEMLRIAEDIAGRPELEGPALSLDRASGMLELRCQVDASGAATAAIMALQAVFQATGREPAYVRAQPEGLAP